MSENMWTIREPNKKDIAFIYATWLNSLYYDSWFKGIQKSVYFDNYKKVIDHILSYAKVSISCLKEDPNTILGYLVSEDPDVIHYLFVKEAFRRFGIAKSLFDHNFISPERMLITHRTRQANQILNTKSQFTYNPFLLYKGEILGN